MLYRFNVNLSDNDYCYFNGFVLTKSRYGKKITMPLRIIITLCCLFFAFSVLLNGGFTPESFLGIIPHIILLVLIQVLINPLALLFNKLILKTSEKKPYSPSSVVEFFEEVFTEDNTSSKNEYKYSAIERVSITPKKHVYLHINMGLAVIIPFSSFESEEQYNEFIGFLKTKARNIDIYN